MSISSKGNLMDLYQELVSALLTDSNKRFETLLRSRYILEAGNLFELSSTNVPWNKLPTLTGH